ncbi:MAG: inositol monophosphatase family protein [Planctomycetaceae bacterium]
MDLDRLIDRLSSCLPPVMRWAGGIARRMRQYNIALAGKHSGSSNTDALTLADLTVQELLVGALRDEDPLFRTCRIEAEETTGDLARFAANGEYTLALDPIDGTKQYRDKTGNGYCIILTLRSPDTVHYSLVFVPESGPFGSWVQVMGNDVVCGPDDPSRPAGDVLGAMPTTPRRESVHIETTSSQRKRDSAPFPPRGGRAGDGGGERDLLPKNTPSPVEGEGGGRSVVSGAEERGQCSSPAPKSIYLIGFQQHDRAKARLVTEAGLEGVAADDCPGAVYELLARGEYAGSLIHTPNVYDFPASLHLARALRGDSLWVHTREPVNFRELWLDERANMLRLPGIVATSPDRRALDILCALARDWNPIRYAE